MLAWVGSTTAGHTKRLTTNAIVMIGYAVGNAAGPQYWEKKYQPRNHIPWLILSICWAVSALLLLATRVYLAWALVPRLLAHDTQDVVLVPEHSTFGERFGQNDMKVGRSGYAHNM
ncbi:hypothetical protein NUW54_g11113 [Trametes sanguinea]|uniref:Uncharacterized protein n=1 Tax=Trametes sanguinea TaxID=158606 RepID=A0ACC1NL22_9APHY|nr:hypothetical protein NUW54_g11113 [Trametes sanguinea]